MMLYLIIIIASVSALLNPYIGLFASFNAFGVFLYPMIEINIRTRLKVSNYAEYEQPKYCESLKKLSKGLIKGWVVLSIIQVVITTVVSTGVWFIASGKTELGVTIMTPWNIFEGNPNINTYSMVLLITSILLSILIPVFVYKRGKYLLNKEYKVNRDGYLSREDIEKINFKVGYTEMIFFILACLVSFMNPYLKWWSLFINMFYLLDIFIIWILIKSYKAIANRNSYGSHDSHYVLRHISPGLPYNRLLKIISFLPALLVLCYNVGIFVYLNNKDLFPSGMNLLTLTLSTLFSLLTALFISRSVGKIGSNIEEENIYE